jgi:hypothetical protein
MHVPFARRPPPEHAFIHPEAGSGWWRRGIVGRDRGGPGYAPGMWGGYICRGPGLIKCTKAWGNP